MYVHVCMPRERCIVVSNLDYPLLPLREDIVSRHRALLPVCVSVIIHWRLHHRIYITANRDAWKAKRADPRLRIGASVRSKLARGTEQDCGEEWKARGINYLGRYM